MKKLFKLKEYFTRSGFYAGYKTWEDALADCRGYDDKEVFEKSLAATLKVKNKEAAYERDTLVYDKIIYSWELLACLQRIGLQSNNRLNVIDFGGSFGTSYFQNKDILAPIVIDNWTVVEQKHYIEPGNKLIADDILNFKESIDEVEGANVIILSGVIQYFENPWEMIKKIIDKGIDYIIFDRTPFSLKNENFIVRQVVSKSMYRGSYPQWFFDENEFLQLFKDKYELVVDFECTYDRAKKIPSVYKGFFFQKIK